MKNTQLNKSFEVVYVKAQSFPEGVEKAHQELRALLPSAEGRTFYGISHPGQNGVIEYKAAATALHPNEAAELGCNTFTIKEGTFLSEIITGWDRDPQLITSTFDTLIHDERIDPRGYCLEEYIDDSTMRCLVPSTIELNSTITRRHLTNDIELTFGRLYHILAKLDNTILNRIPFEGSWTAGQTFEHIILSSSGIPDRSTTTSTRFPDEKVYAVARMFLDFNLKFQTDPSIQPRHTVHKKEELLAMLQEMETNLKISANTSDLDALCLDMVLPTFGFLTRYEWLRFVLVHMQRHAHQVENIYRVITGEK